MLEVQQKLSHVPTFNSSPVVGVSLGVTHPVYKFNQICESPLETHPILSNHEANMDDPPPVPPKLYPQLELVVLPEDLPVLHALPAAYKKDERSTHSHKKPSPAPRSSLSANTRQKNDTQLPIPKPRNLVKRPRAIDNPLYFTVNIQNPPQTQCEILNNGNVETETLPACNDSVETEQLPVSNDNVENEKLSLVDLSPPEEVVLEFDPFAPGKGITDDDHVNLHLTGSVFSLDKIVNVCDNDESNSEDVVESCNDKEHLDFSPNDIIAKNENSMNPDSDNFCSYFSKIPHDLQSASLSEKCPATLEDPVTNMNSTSSGSVDQTGIDNPNYISGIINLNSAENNSVKSFDTEENDELLNSEDFQSSSSTELDPPAFPPPPLPDGFSASCLSLLDTDGFLESCDFFARKSDTLPSHSSSSSSVVSDKPPLPPKTQTRKDSIEAPKLGSSSPLLSRLNEKTSSSASSSRDSSPLLSHRQLTLSVIGDKVPPPPVKTSGQNAIPSENIPSDIKPLRPAPAVPSLPSSVSEENAPPLPPKSKSHFRTKSWNFADFKAVGSLFRNNSPFKNPYTNNSSHSQTKVSHRVEDRMSCISPFSGFLHKTGSNRKDFRQRWCVFENGHFKYYADEKSDVPQNSIHQKDIISVAKIRDVKNNIYDLSCFEVNTIKDKSRSYLFGASIPSDRENWMEHIAYVIAPDSCKTTNYRDFVKAGYCYVRVGMIGKWQTCWLVFRGKTILISNESLESPKSLDLRKAMLIQMLPADKHQCYTQAREEGSSFHVDFPGKSIYVQADLRKETDSWYMLIRQAIYDIGDSLESQQLTMDNVPVIIDKCLTFISIHGLTVEGIYRLSGTSSKVTKLLSLLKEDAWGFNLKLEDFTVHEVATAVKRFIRTLPVPLLTTSLYDQWLKASALENLEDQIEAYKNLLNQLPEINYCTLKCIINHLRSIKDYSEKNFMTLTNLASIFGPTLLTTDVEGGIPNLLNTNFEMDVVAHLIQNYPVLFKVSAEELQKDLAIQKALLELKEAKRAKKPAGDLLIGVYIYSKEWGKCLNVRISPTMTAQELCIYAVHNHRIKEKLEQISVFEVVCNGELERSLHYSEVILSVTLQWAGWSDNEAKDNYLLIKKNDLYPTILPLARQPISMFSELRFADRKSKHFKKFLLEFKNARLSFYKDAKISQPENSWNVEDIVWYIGNEQKRPGPTKWAFTFIEKKTGVKRTKDSSYFGWTVCCNSEEEFNRWIAALLIGEYPNGLLPKKDTLDLLS